MKRAKTFHRGTLFLLAGVLITLVSPILTIVTTTGTRVFAAAGSCSWTNANTITCTGNGSTFQFGKTASGTFNIQSGCAPAGTSLHMAVTGTAQAGGTGTVTGTQSCVILFEQKILGTNGNPSRATVTVAATNPSGGGGGGGGGGTANTCAWTDTTPSSITLTCVGNLGVYSVNNTLVPGTGVNGTTVKLGLAGSSTCAVTIANFSTAKTATLCTTTASITNTFQALATTQGNPTNGLASTTGSAAAQTVDPICVNGSQPQLDTKQKKMVCSDGTDAICSDGSTPDTKTYKCPAVSSSDCGAGALAWIVCPVDFALQHTANLLLRFIKGQLTIDTGCIFNGKGNCSGTTGAQNSAAYYTAWNVFRVLGTSLIIIAALVMISSQALGFEFLDAYTIRKTLPRLFVAVIGMSLSWPLLNFVISFFNTLGNDIQNLMYAPFSHLPNHAQAAGGIASWSILGVVGGMMALGFGGVLLPILATGALALLIAVLILIIRQVAVTLLVILAPLAIAAYVLPNTKKIWDLWKDNFLGMMIVFPIITMLIAAGQIFSAVGNSASFLQQIVGLVAFFVPYFMIPLAFRMATGFISTITGMVNDRSKGAFDRLRAARQNKMAHQWGQVRANNAFKGGNEDNLRGKWNKVVGTASNIDSAGFNPTKMRSSMRAAATRREKAEIDKFREENEAHGMIAGNEDFLRAARDSKGNEQAFKSMLRSKLDDNGNRAYSDATIDQAAAQVRSAQRAVSSEVFQKATVLSEIATGTGLKVERRHNKIRDTSGKVIGKEWLDEHGNVVANEEDAALTGGAGEVNKLINEEWGNDRVGAVSALVQGRQLAGQARRFDISGGSTGAAIGHLEAQHNYESRLQTAIQAEMDAGADRATAESRAVVTVGGDTATQQTQTTATKQMIREALEGQGGSYVAGSRKGAVEAFAPEMLAKLQEAASSGDIRQFNQELAAIAGRYDAMASVSPENARVLADKVLSMKLAGSDITVQEQIERNRNVPEFDQMRREYDRQARTGAFSAAEEAQRMRFGGPQGGPGGPDGTGGPMGPVMGGP